MKTKLFVAFALLLLAGGALWWWLAGGKRLPDYIPARSKAVVRFSAAAFARSEMPRLIAEATGLPALSATEGDAYFFVTPNEYFGAALTLRDASAFVAAMPPCVTATEEGGARWFWTEAGWLAALRGSTLLVLGPATAQERDRLAHTLRVMLDAPASEGFACSPRATSLPADAPVALLASPSVLPAPYGTLLRLGLPDTKADIAATIALADTALVVSGAAIGAAQALPALPDARPAHLLQATLRADGPELLKRMRSDGTLRLMLTALSDSTSAAADIRRLCGTASLLVTAIDTAGAPTFLLTGRDKDGRPVTLRSRHAPTVAPSSAALPDGLSAYAAVRIDQLLAAPLPEGVSPLLRALLGGYSRATLATTPGGAFRFTLTR